MPASAIADGEPAARRPPRAGRSARHRAPARALRPLGAGRRIGFFPRVPGGSGSGAPGMLRVNGTRQRRARPARLPRLARGRPGGADLASRPAGHLVSRAPLPRRAPNRGWSSVRRWFRWIRITCRSVEPLPQHFEDHGQRVLGFLRFVRCSGEMTCDVGSCSRGRSGRLGCLLRLRGRFRSAPRRALGRESRSLPVPGSVWAQPLNDVCGRSRGGR